MNIRESGVQGARRVTTVIGVVGAALASIIGLSVWAGTSASASSGTTVVQGGDDGQRGDSGGLGVGGSNGFINPGQGGNSHGTSNGS
jgi:hypothetical protein